MKSEELKHNFTYHAPTPKKQEVYALLREMGLEFAIAINRLPESREKSLALTKLEECVMWANASIARSGDEQ